MLIAGPMRIPALLLLLSACTGADDVDLDFPDGPRPPGGDKEDKEVDIPYRGGSVLHHPIEVHLYLGGWWNGADGRRDRRVLDAFASRAGDSEWYQILAEYPDGRGAPGPSVAGAAAVLDDTEPGDRVSDRALRKIVVAAIESQAVPWNSEAVYFVFTPPGSAISTPWGLSCDVICGYHYHFQGTIRGRSRDVRYAGIPYGDCPADCSSAGVSANGAALDQMTVTLSHELAEAVTDPSIDAWTGPRGDPECADPCDGGFVAEWGGAPFAVQDIWSNAARACVRGPQ